MARTVYGEARGQEFLGLVAVAWVIRNRADHPRWWGSDIKGVCLKPLQFSCWNDDDPNRAIITAVTADNPLFQRCMGVTSLVIYGDLEDPTHGATHYYTTNKPHWAEQWPPRWAEETSMKYCTTIGAHVFMRETV